MLSSRSFTTWRVPGKAAAIMTFYEVHIHIGGMSQKFWDLPRNLALNYSVLLELFLYVKIKVILWGLFCFFIDSGRKHKSNGK